MPPNQPCALGPGRPLWHVRSAVVSSIRLRAFHLSRASPQKLCQKSGPSVLRFPRQTRSSQRDFPRRVGNPLPLRFGCQPGSGKLRTMMNKQRTRGGCPFLSQRRRDLDIRVGVDTAWAPGEAQRGSPFSVCRAPILGPYLAVKRHSCRKTDVEKNTRTMLIFRTEPMAEAGVSAFRSPLQAPWL
jgi:hypothetical protein